MHGQVIDFSTLGSGLFVAPVARSVWNLPAVTAKRLQETIVGTAACVRPVDGIRREVDPSREMMLAEGGGSSC